MVITGASVVVVVVVMVVRGSGHVVGQGLAQFVVANEVFLTLGNGAQGGFFFGMGGFFSQQGFAVFLRDLVIVRMDFAECQEAVAIAAKIHESRLQRRFDAGNLG